MKLNLMAKLLGGFLIVAAIIAALGVFSILQIRNINQNAVQLGIRGKESIYRVGQIQLAVGHYRRHQILRVAVLTDAQKKDAEDTITSDDALIKQSLADYKTQGLFTNPDEQALYDKVVSTWNTYLQQSQGFLPLAQAGKNDEAIAVLTGDADKTFDQVMATQKDWMTYNENQTIQLVQDSQNIYNTALIFSVVAILLAVAASIILGLLISRPLARDARNLAAMADNISRGELHQTLTVKRSDEIGMIADAFTRMHVYLQDITRVATRVADGDLREDVVPVSDKDILGTSFSKMIANLRRLIRQVNADSNNLTKASVQLANTSTQAGKATQQIATIIQEVTRGSTQQTESVTRTAANVSQLTHVIDGVARGAQEQAMAVGKVSDVSSKINASIQQVAANAKSGVQGSKMAAQSAQSGVKTVSATVQGMETIREKVGVSAVKVKEMGQRSEQIGAIVETIQDIASQTNLLALNAAIEAARAGEHGKGFSVVADEVRKLAEKSASATKEISGLIKGIQTTVNEAVKAMEEGASEIEQGVMRANDSGTALSEILKEAEGVNQQVLQIASAAEQMEALSNHLISAAESVSAVVEENTAATEQMAASSNEVSQAIENIASVSEENSASVEEVSASVDEMAAQVAEVATSANGLAKMAELLRDSVVQFKLQDKYGRVFAFFE